MRKKIVFSLFLMFVGLFLISFTAGKQNDPWVVPDAAKNKKNPIQASTASINNGKSLYNLHCASCHGKTGKGDGSKAANLETDCGDFTSAEFQKQTDGSILYKTVQGRDDMPSYKKKLPDEADVWDIVNYIRTLKAK